MRITFLVLSVVALVIGCRNLEDVAPDERISFYRTFSGASDYVGKTVEIDASGFIVGLDSVVGSNYSAIIIKTDPLGSPLWRKKITDASVSSIKVIDDGYLILGSSIHFIDTLQVVDQTKYNARLIKMDQQGNIQVDREWGSPIPIATTVDYSGNAINIRNNKIYTVWSHNKSNPGRKLAIVAEHEPTTLDTLWTQEYSLQDRDLRNGSSVCFTPANNIVWAASALNETQSNKSSYLNIPVVEPNSVFVNSSRFGQNEDAFYSGADMKASAVGFGVVGTYSTTTGLNSNIYFVRLDPSGNVVDGTQLFFDASLSRNNEPLADKSLSETQDVGSAIAVTDDGGFLLAGSFTTAAAAAGEIGSGGTDIYLIRINAFGSLIWSKTFGGTGNESISSVRQTADGGFILCGTNNLNELSSAILFKINSEGELRD